MTPFYVLLQWAIVFGSLAAALIILVSVTHFWKEDE